MGNSVNFSRLLHITYPALVFFAALMAWTKTGYGTNGEAGFMQPNFSFVPKLSLVASEAACSKSDTLSFLRANTCPDGEEVHESLGRSLASAAPTSGSGEYAVP